MYHGEGGAVWRRSVYIDETMCDGRGNMRPDALTMSLQNTAGLYLTDCGLTLDALAAADILLVLVWAEIRVERLPQCGETVAVETWFGKERHWLYPAHYVCRSQGGDVLARGATWWSSIDGKHRRLAPPSPVTRRIPVQQREGEFTAADSEPFPAHLPYTQERTVTPQEIDHNCHMNNAHYVAWAQSLLPRDCGQLKRLWAEYRQELLEGQTAQMRYGWQDGTFYVEGLYQGESSFRVALTYGE